MRTTTLLLMAIIVMAGCSSPAETEKASNDGPPHGPGMATSLTFQDGNAEQAMNFYVGVFDDARVIDIRRWGAEGPGVEGTVMQAWFELGGQRFIVSDSPPVHDWDFSPAVSNYVECASAEVIERLFAALSEGGTVAMPLGNYGFSQQFGWLIDQFGVSWQLNLK